MKPLIFDVGMYDGDDTAYYLHRGYRVVAIEADPTAVERARGRFAGAIAAGDLTILNVGIAAEAGEATFWLCETVPVWSSFDRNIASRMGSAHRPIVVPCVQFADVLRAHDRPYYVKVDIEGNDRFCVDALTPEHAPRYVSVEMSHEAGIMDITALHRAGYRRFMCIRQNDFRAIEPRTVARFHRALELGVPERVARRLLYRIREPRTDAGGYQHRPGSSGPFGQDLPGRWLDLAEISMVWSHLSAMNGRWLSLTYWYDIHAARDDAE